ncbi:MAG: hypothetical protein IKM73_07805 [Acidaminococcaceae bacterium]|nr:hypothetical protein [Acidaminococcaceae bacterium]
MWEIVETDKKGRERVLKKVATKPVAERAARLRKSILADRGRLDDFDVKIRKAEKEE